MNDKRDESIKKWYQKKKNWIIIFISLFIISGIHNLGTSSVNKKNNIENSSIAKNKTKDSTSNKKSIVAKQSDQSDYSTKSNISEKPEKKTKTDTPVKTESEQSKQNTTVETHSVPTEYNSALIKAYSYSRHLHLSKLGILQQLTSQYGEKFSQPAAQYAIDNLHVDWNENALAKAKSYQRNLSMSPEGIRQQLTSQYGEKFTPEEANYAISHLN